MPQTITDLVTLTPDHQYIHADGHRVPGVSSILRAANIRPAPYMGRTVHGVDVMKRALERGTQVHRITRAIDETYDEFDALDDTFDPADFSAENVNYISAYHSFLNGEDYRPAAWEKIVYNDLYDYAGKPDMVGWLNHRRIMADRKTDRQLHRAVWLQLCFYRMAWERCYPSQLIDQTFALKLNADTTYELIPNPLERGGDPFCVAAVWIHRWQNLQV